MGSENKVILIFCFVVLLLSFASSTAAQDFMAVSQKPAITVCEGSTSVDVITLQNTGHITNTYTAVLQGEASVWATLAPNVVTLNPGQITSLYNHVTVPFGSNGDYELKTYISSTDGSVKVLSQTVSVKTCLNLEVEPVVVSQTACQCSPATYRVSIKNTGNYPETYYLSLTSFSNHALYTKNPVVISPGQSEEADIVLKMPCTVSGKGKTTLKVHAKESGFSASVPLEFKIIQCYDFDIVAADSYNICEEQTTIPLNLVNKDVENSYELKLAGPKWASLYPDKLNISTKSAKTFQLNLNPEPKEEGVFELTLDVTALKGEVSKQKKITLVKQVCYSPKLIADRNIAVNYSETLIPLTIKNTGSKKASYFLEVAGPSWISLDSREFILNPGEEQNFNIRSTPGKSTEKGTYPVKITVLVRETNDLYVDAINIQLKEFKKFPTLLYLLVLTPLLLLLLIFFAIKLLSKPKKTEEKLAVKKPEEKPIVKKMELKPAKVIKKEKPKPKKKQKPKTDYRKLLKKLSFMHYLALAILLILIVLIIIHFLKPGYLTETLNSVSSSLKNLTSKIHPASQEVPKSLKDYLKDLWDFLRSYLYYIFAGIALLVVFIILINLSKKKPKKAKQEIKAVKKEVKSEKKIKPKTPAPGIKGRRWGWYIIGLILLAGIIFLVYRYFSVILNFVSWAFAELSTLISGFFAGHPSLTSAVSAIEMYRNYILLGILLLVALIFILKFVKKPGKKQEKEVAEKKAEKETAEPPAYWSYLSWIVGLIIFLGIIYYLFVYLIIPYWRYVLVGIAALVVLLLLIVLLNKIKTKRTEEMIWAEAMPNQDNIMVIGNRRWGIGELILKSKKKLYNVKVTLRKLRKKPTFIRASEEVYEYYEIKKENLENADMRKAIIRFKVKKSWLNKNSANKKDVVLKRYANKWIELPTKAVDSDDNFVYYESETERLSYFAIALKKEERVIKESPKKWFWVILLALLIVGGLYYYFASQEAPTAPTEQTSPVLKEGLANQVWDEDTALTIDLSKYFYDPDGDKLVFTSTKPENIDVEISGPIAVLTPRQNWNGIAYIVFTADDGKGGIVSTDKVTLTVNDVPEQLFFKTVSDWTLNTGRTIKDFFTLYFRYVAYGIIALVVVLLVVKYNKPLLNFFLEEEDEKKKTRKRGSEKS